MVKVSVIFVSYNTEKLTLDAISSVYEMTKEVKYEIILVDNNSKDNTVSSVKDRFPDVKVIENQENFGFGYANNIGAKIASGNYIFLLNTDTLLVNNAIKILSDYLDNHPNVAVAGGNLFDENMNPATSYSRVFPSVLLGVSELFFNFLSLKIFNNHFNYTKLPLEFKGSISGADSMIRKNVFDLVGGFDKKFFLYYEETDLFYRITRMDNLVVASIPEAKIIHLEGRSEEIKEKTLERSFKSKYIYLNKHSNAFSMVAQHLLIKITAIIRIVIFYFLNKRKKLNLWKSILRIENEMYIKNNGNIKK